MTTTVVLNDEQEQIQEVARLYLDAEYNLDRVRELAAGELGFDPERWRQIAELGWTGIAVPEDADGMGYGIVELCLLLEEMGRVLLPAPFLSSIVLAAPVVLCAGGTPAGRALLSELAAGTRRAALIAPGTMNGAEPLDAVTASVDGASGHVVDGRTELVLDASSAETFVVVARLGDGDVGVFRCDRDAAGVTVTPQPVVDPTRRMGSVDLSSVSVERIDGGQATAARVRAGLAHATVGLSAEMVGAMQRCVEITIAYVRDREQFGRPIGSFQAIKHRCADMAIEADAAREAVLFAADVLDSGDPALAESVASLAKSVVSDAFVHAAAEMIQMHGGIGYTEEHSAHLYYKRALLCAQMLGTAVEHRDRLARASISAADNPGGAGAAA